jgi:hypothetical protein
VGDDSRSLPRINHSCVPGLLHFRHTENKEEGMFATQEQLEKIGKQNMEAALAVAQVQLGAFEKLASLNLELTRVGFRAWTHNLEAFARTADAQAPSPQEPSSAVAKGKKSE